MYVEYVRMQLWLSTIEQQRGGHNPSFVLKIISSSISGTLNGSVKAF